MVNETFQRAVKKDVSRARRTESIRTLIERGDATNLAVIVRTSGLSGTFRRQALDGLARCGSAGRDRLAELADDPAIEPTLRGRAAELG